MRLPNLARDGPQITDTQFKNCTILGPAVVAPLESFALMNCNFNTVGRDALFLTVPPGKPLIGVIALLRRRFVRCRFDQIGLAGTADDVAKWRKAFTGALPDEPGWLAHLNR